MDIRDKGIQTQLKTIGEATGLSWDELKAVVLGWSGSHTEVRTRVQDTWGLGLMHAETVVLCARQREGDPLEAAREWYTGAKQAFWPVHEALAAAVLGWEGVEAVAKKGYLSLRRTKQFATWGPATNTRFEVGLNGRHLVGGPRLAELPPGQICHFKVVVPTPDDVDAELVGWLRSAYDRA